MAIQDNKQNSRNDLPFVAHVAGSAEAQDMPLAPGIVRNPARMSGRATIAGTRITVANVLARIAAGQTLEDVLSAYPHLTHQHILDALAYAAQLVEANDPPVFDVASSPDLPEETIQTIQQA